MEAGAQNGPPSGANSSSDFVRKLYKMLQDPAYHHVVRWASDGHSFVVLENESFTKSVLPKHFKHSNFASFVRQLNKYDFHKVRHNNEESGQSPYGANAWEFKHPDFKMNGKESLENIRRKAPATRKSLPSGDEVVPTSQMDLVNTQLVAMQQQQQQLSDRYNELSVHYSMLLTELIGVQKSVVNHEHVMQNVMTYLHSADSIFRDQRRNHRGERSLSATLSNGTVSSMPPPAQQFSPGADSVSSPLQNADRLLNDGHTETLLHPRNLEQMNEFYRQASANMTVAAPATSVSPAGVHLSETAAAARPATTADPAPAIDFSRLATEFHDVVYPIGQNTGINPMFSEHLPNIPYPLPAAGDVIADDARRPPPDGRKKSTSIDPGWIRPPQVLLVEDDPTCRRIGSKFLYSFKCAIDSAFDGLEAVNKMNGGSKYDLVLMDIIMPNLDGVSACHLIRQFDSTPIIAMTSNIRGDDISMYFSHGMNDVLPKPFTREGLLTMLEKHLGHLKASAAPDEMSPPQIGPGPGRPALKDDTSSIKSESTSNWQSPTQASGISPSAHGLNDDYATALARRSSYGIEPTSHSDLLGFPSPDRLVVNRPGIHRRQSSMVSDVSAPEESPTSTKRPRLFPPTLPPPPLPPPSALQSMSASIRSTQGHRTAG